MLGAIAEISESENPPRSDDSSITLSRDRFPIAETFSGPAPTPPPKEEG